MICPLFRCFIINILVLTTILLIVVQEGHGAQATVSTLNEEEVSTPTHCTIQRPSHLPCLCTSYGLARRRFVTDGRSTVLGGKDEGHIAGRDQLYSSFPVPFLERVSRWCLCISHETVMYGYTTQDENNRFQKRFVALVALVALVTLATLATLVSFVSFVSLVSLVSVVSLCQLVHKKGSCSGDTSYSRNSPLMIHQEER
jgi:hypothetical protein